ncbi:glycosyl hydrolase family 28-related protein [Haloferula rosea]|uniref:Rhamnogalacturonase A/B/Epimerase-like pectate lyase domain-containing protein n=1 Tax=Haloferula rosea TaxID=490093 RepID=A0A934VA32_9BACT|nr:glycosyl hydrolase family 28-related protein [Haloferula rosea]MBK1825873.1 hypothetical protein [Haloferula rosea]
MNIRSCSISLLILAGSSFADTVWNPAANAPPVVAPDTGDWADVGNWTNGIPADSPPAETKGVFNVGNAATCEINALQDIHHLVMDVDGSGSELHVLDGGTLTTGDVWSAIGYSQAGSRLVVQGGGTAVFADHLWIGFNSGANGTLHIDGGTVEVSGQLGLGWEGGTGTITIENGGQLKLDQLHPTRSLSGTSVVDIAEGSIVIQGDRSTAILDYISAGKITGYGGSGTPIYDYDVSHPGMTTIRAIATPIPAQWRVVSTIHPTTDWVITPFDAVNDFGIVADGVTDVTQLIQDALTMLGNLGGGALFLPAGHYRLDGNLVIPQGVTLRGDWKTPIAGDAVVGTVLNAYAGRGDENAPPFIKLNNSAGVRGITIWYPEQVSGNPQPYPPTLGNGGGATIENITLLNSWFGFTTFINGTTARPFVRHIYGTPLKTGLEFDCLADIGRIESVHFSPDFWAGSGLPGAPASGEHEAWLLDEATGIIVRRIDWSYSCYVRIEGYHIGLALRPGRHDGHFPNGQSYGFDLAGCRTGVFVEASAYAGYQFTRFSITDAEIGIHIASGASEANSFHTCSIDANVVAIRSDGEARVSLMSCDIQKGPIRLSGGYLSLIDSDFAGTSPIHLELRDGVRGASILGNRFAGPSRIVNRSPFPVLIDHNPISARPLPDYEYRMPSDPRRPVSTDLFVVTDLPYQAVGDGIADDAPAFQAALTAAANQGGGTVFVPGGTYRMNSPLVIPGGVELRGVFDLPHDTKVKGSLLNIHSGYDNADGTPFIQLEGGSGLRGISFHYPDQIHDENDAVNYGKVPYPYLLRGLGPDIHVLNLSATIPYQLLDLATHRCDRHYIDYIFSTALKTGIHVGNGTTDGQIHNCQLNPSAYTHAGNYYESIPFDTADDIHEILWRDATPYLFGDMTGQVLHQNFVFGGARGFHLVAEGTGGPSGHCLGMGVDQCTIAMLIEQVGGSDLAPINSQIVTVNATAGRYLETGTSLDRPFTMFSLAGWGSHQFSSVLRDGDVELQLFHIAPGGQAGTFKLQDDASLTNIGGNLRNHLPNGRPYLIIDPSASATFTGNIINTVPGQMPANTSNVTSIANLRIDEAPSGTDTIWTNAEGNDDWNSDGNWTNQHPDGTVSAVVNDQSSTPPVIHPETSATSRNLNIGTTAIATSPLLIDGGSLNTVEWIILGDDANHAGTLDINDGQATCGGDLFVGYDGQGFFRVNGGNTNIVGSLVIAPFPGSTGTVILSAGSLSATALSMSEGGSLDLTDGLLILDGDHRELLTHYIEEGWLTTHAGTALPSFDFDITNAGKTTITGTPPEPTATVWNATGAEAWGVDTHWTGNVAPIDQAQHLKVVFNVEGAAACTLDAPATVAQLVAGDNGTLNGNLLTLASGAHLVAGLDPYGQTRWTAVGYNRDATVKVTSGATLSVEDHLWIGFHNPSNGSLEIEGGTVTVAGQLGLGWIDGTGSVRISDGGTLMLSDLHPTASIKGASVIDIEVGSMTLPGDRTIDINNYVTAGKITGYGSTGTVFVEYDLESNITKVTATPPTTGYEVWADTWGADIGTSDHDHDKDGRSNFYEYAFNGDPTDASNRGIAPGISTTSPLTLSHLIRKGDPLLIYQIEASHDLTDGSWQETNLTQIDLEPHDIYYDQIIFELPAATGARFFRLTVAYPDP